MNQIHSSEKEKRLKRVIVWRQPPITVHRERATVNTCFNLCLLYLYDK